MPSVTDAPQTWAFALLFDLPAAIDPATGLTLVNRPGPPILIEEPLSPVLAPTPTPTPVPTATPAPTANPSPPARRSSSSGGTSLTTSAHAGGHPSPMLARPGPSG